MIPVNEVAKERYAEFPFPAAKADREESVPEDDGNRRRRFEVYRKIRRDEKKRRNVRGCKKSARCVGKTLMFYVYDHVRVYMERVYVADGDSVINI